MNVIKLTDSFEVRPPFESNRLSATLESPLAWKLKVHYHENSNFLECYVVLLDK